MVEENGKVPVGIVNTVVNKISEFTKEVEILRAQLPKEQSTIAYKEEIRSSVDKLAEKVEDTNKSVITLISLINDSVKTFRIIFGVIGMAIILAFVAAQGMTYYERHKLRVETNIVIEKTVEETIDKYIKKYIVDDKD